MMYVFTVDMENDQGGKTSRNVVAESAIDAIYAAVADLDGFGSSDVYDVVRKPKVDAVARQSQ